MYHSKVSPLGTYDFGGTIGVQNVGNTDTIMSRPTDIVCSAGSTLPFTADLVALQLRSVDQVSIFGGPVGYYYVTLQSVRGGTASNDTGSTIFNSAGTGGTFSDALDVLYDVRYGALNGPVVYSSDCSLVNAGADWTHDRS
jgi:hypothetical protein